mgnify:CR=1 FL=1
MRADIQIVINEIEKSLSLLRQRLDWDNVKKKREEFRSPGQNALRALVLARNARHGTRHAFGHPTAHAMDLPFPESSRTRVSAR